MTWIKTGLESFLRQSGLVCSSSVSMLSFSFLHKEEIFSYWVTAGYRELEELLHEKKIYGWC